MLKFRYIYYGQVGGEDRMQRIQVHPDVLEEKARLVQQKKLELERMVRELEKSIYLLQSEWSGVTGERFFWDFMQVKEVFPATLGLLDKIQNEFIFIAKNFRTADGSGEVALYIPEELKRNFGVGLLDKSVGETVTGIGQTAEALFYDPFGTVTSVAYAMTLGRVVDVGRGIKFAWDAAWGNGTARSDVGQFVDEQKKQVNESGAGYYSGSVMGQVLAYAFVGRALRSVENKHSDLGGSGGKTNSGKGKEGPGKVDLTEPTLSPGGKPKGKYEKPDPNDPNPITFQNEAADLLASKGYDIDMLPNTKGGNGYGINPTSNPDFLINGKAFDCYSPETLKVRNIWATVMKKTEEQTGRIVMNLDGYKGSMDELYEQFNKYEISTLSELIYIKDGQITRLKP
ncbi:WXG100 family type VII secretion target [Paenibacillus taichungensis]|uniref:CdiA C-terminal domain-containing protein n=2 Tax=Paenibacillus taichungensis TaxID=484184 RepID=UPI0028713014|nr:WXG100 family type VII secretion target [Paenibacillus taichungensis]MDR9743811.1 WXG100 family type VII secretion target [Paenibacillus taichungensis]MEC0197105.1 WXG100 family type VII secretion target [Paenibacillus taichungensis]